VQTRGGAIDAGHAGRPLSIERGWRAAVFAAATRRVENGRADQCGACPRGAVRSGDWPLRMSGAPAVAGQCGHVPAMSA
jgi:hypothetical protein